MKILADKLVVKVYREDGSKAYGILDTLVTANLEDIAVRQRVDWVR
jgi:hypothetical protein